MLYIQKDQKVKKISRFFYVTQDKKLRQINTLYSQKNGAITTVNLQNNLPVLGQEGELYQKGLIVLEGYGLLFDKPGNYTFTIPDGIKTIHIVAIGAGGSGGRKDGYASGGGGGGLAAIINTPITQSEALTITVGKGGAGSTIDTDGEAGEGSSIEDYITATGGKGGKQNGASIENGGMGTIIKKIKLPATSITGVGGNGGGESSNTGLYDGGGGGGAAGYGGKGGNGGGEQQISGQQGESGGGGGGGSAGNNGVGGKGGGTGPFGKGDGGVGGVSTDDHAAKGQPGSVHASYLTKFYGGGGGGAGAPANTEDAQGGAVLICWGKPLKLQ